VHGAVVAVAPRLVEGEAELALGDLAGVERVVVGRHRVRDVAVTEDPQHFLARGGVDLGRVEPHLGHGHVAVPAVAAVAVPAAVVAAVVVAAVRLAVVGAGRAVVAVVRLAVVVPAAVVTVAVVAVAVTAPVAAVVTPVAVVALVVAAVAILVVATLVVGLVAALVGGFLLSLGVIALCRRRQGRSPHDEEPAQGRGNEDTLHRGPLESIRLRAIP
jgi:hypothetical protein